MVSSHEQPDTAHSEIGAKKHRRRLLVAIAFVISFAVALFLLRRYLNVEALVEHEQALHGLFERRPVFFVLVAFLIYVLVTGLSIPGATLMSLIYAWFFGFTRGVVLISFASTAGATLAFLISRYVFRGWFQTRFSERLSAFNQALDEEGAYYLFTLRLIPLVPYFVVNVVMGLTKMKVTTFWWVSQLGMLLGTITFVYAGSSVPDLKTLSEKGLEAIFSAEQLTKFAIAFALIGLLPIGVKTLVKKQNKTTIAGS